MTTAISSHFSFIVRCWRDANGTLRGWVVDALTQRAYPFAAGQEITARIESLMQETPADEITEEDNSAESV